MIILLHKIKEKREIENEEKLDGISKNKIKIFQQHKEVQEKKKIITI